MSQNLWVAPNGRLEATVHLDQQAPSGSEIAVVIYQRLRSRSLFQASLDGELGSSLATISRPIGDLPRDERGDIVVAVPLSESNEAGRTRLRVDGVYPVRIELRNEDGDEIDGFTTHLAPHHDPTRRARIHSRWRCSCRSPPRPHSRPTDRPRCSTKIATRSPP